MKVALLTGGWSSEREVSLMSGKAVHAALNELGHDVLVLDLMRDIKQFETLVSFKPEVVFNALHGPWGEDGRIQAVLDFLAIPYTHSDVLASALALNKQKTKEVLSYHKIPVPPGRVVTRQALQNSLPESYPVVLKPICEGSTIGVHIVKDETQLRSALQDRLLGNDFIVEQYIRGRELSCAVLNGKALGVIEIVPKSGFYTYDAKYSEGLCEHLMPAPLGSAEKTAVRSLSEQTFSVIGCRGLARVDLRYDPTLGIEGGLFVLEINSQPGLTPQSLAPEIAKYAGYSFTSLIAEILENALD